METKKDTRRKYATPKMSIMKLNPFFLACSSGAAQGCHESVFPYGQNPGQAGVAGKPCPC
jgi:hypothetical protein